MVHRTCRPETLLPLAGCLIYQSLAKLNLEYPAVSKERRAELLSIRKVLERD